MTQPRCPWIYKLIRWYFRWQLTYPVLDPTQYRCNVGIKEHERQYKTVIYEGDKRLLV